MSDQPFRPKAFIDCPECKEDAFAFSSKRFPEGDIWYECMNHHRISLADYLRTTPDAEGAPTVARRPRAAPSQLGQVDDPTVDARARSAEPSARPVENA